MSIYAGWIDTKDGCLVTQYNPNHEPLAIKDTVKGYELLQHTDIGWFRVCETFTIEDAMRHAAKLLQDKEGRGAWKCPRKQLS